MKLSRKTVQAIKTAFHVIFIAFISFELLREAFFSIPNDWLFFLTSGAVENFLCALMAYALYYYILKLNFIWKKIVWIFLGILLLLLISYLKDYRIHDTIEFEQTFEYLTSFLGLSLLFYLAIYFINRLEFLNRYKNLERELNQAKEQLLRNQLHPHFLFNALNSLYSLSLKNHPETSEYILKLSNMMRYLTDDTHLKRVPLNKELDFIEQYIDIEKIRFGKDARINLIFEDDTNSEKFIAPYLLISLVENAFKHGFYTNSKDAFVNINLNVKNNQLQFTVENSFLSKQHFQISSREGKGLDNLKKRLHFMYPNSSSMDVTTTEETYRTQLQIILT